MIAGFAILAGIIALVAFVFFLGDITRAFGKHYSIFLVFPSAEGLRVGSPVWIAGHEVGAVATIGFRPVGADSIPSVALRVTLPGEHQSQVRRDSRVKITRPRPMSEPVIDIAPGSAGSPMLQEGDTIFGVMPPTVEAAFNNLITLRIQVDSLLMTSRRLSPLASQRKRQVTRVLGGLGVIQAELAALRESFRPDARNLADPQLRTAFERTALTIKQLPPLFAGAARDFQGPELKGAFAALQQRTSSLAAQFDSLNAVMVNGSLSRFAQDSAIMKALHAAQVELDSVMAVTKRNPLRFWLGDRKE